MITEFQIGEFNYQSKKLSAMDQLYIVKRLAPIMGSLAGAFKKLGLTSEFKLTDENFSELIEPLTSVLSGISDADLEFVINRCLRVTSRQERGGVGWANITANNDFVMFPDIDLPVMLQITWNVLRSNLANFSLAKSFVSLAPAPAAA